MAVSVFSFGPQEFVGASVSLLSMPMFLQDEALKLDSLTGLSRVPANDVTVDGLGIAGEPVELFAVGARHSVEGLVGRVASVSRDEDAQFVLTRDLYVLRSLCEAYGLSHCGRVAELCARRMRLLARRGSSLTHFDRSGLNRALRVLGQMLLDVQRLGDDGSCAEGRDRACAILEMAI